MKRVSLQPAYVLHRRSYRETSYLVDLFTPEHGRLTVIARGARKQRSSSPGLLQSFMPLLVSFAGNGELMMLSQMEANGAVVRLQGECLFAGLYLNELLTGLLQKWDAHPDIYHAYEKVIQALQTKTLAQKTLRSFEMYLLEQLGYGLLPKTEVELHQTFSAEKHYRFVADHGFVQSELGDHAGAKSSIFSGQSLLSIAKEHWEEEEVLKDAKRLIRMVLAPLLGVRPLYSRQLFLLPP